MRRLLRRLGGSVDHGEAKLLGVDDVPDGDDVLGWEVELDVRLELVEEG